MRDRLGEVHPRGCHRVWDPSLTKRFSFTGQGALFFGPWWHVCSTSSPDDRAFRALGASRVAYIHVRDARAISASALPSVWASLCWSFESLRC